MADEIGGNVGTGIRLSDSEGNSAERQGAIVYVHGGGNQPRPSELKRVWDEALFGHELGDRTRLAYWRDARRYPHYLATGATGDLASSDAPHVLAPQEVIDDLISTLCKDGRKKSARLLNDVSKVVMGHDTSIGGTGPRDDVSISQSLANRFLPDLYHYCFEKERQKEAERAVHERICAGGGPFVLVAYGLGALVAYNALRAMSEEPESVDGMDPAREVMLVTLGCPLGIPAIKNWIKKSRWSNLEWPSVVERWFNLAHEMDCFAQEPLDEFISGHESQFEQKRMSSAAGDRRPTTAVEYLGNRELLEKVRSRVDVDVTQQVSRFVIAKNLSAQTEDAGPLARHEVLIEYADLDDDPQHSRLKAALNRIVAGKEADAKVEYLKRYAAACLTRFELEQLASAMNSASLGRIWQDAQKSSLLYQSAKTVHVTPAQHSYGASGEGMGWAVLDTGVDGGHPHFQKYQNVVAQWDCTQPTVQPRLERPSVDPNGHGTHVAGVIAGASEPLDLPGVGTVRMSGMAPKVKLYSYRVLTASGGGRDSFIIKALDHIAETNEKAGKLVIHGVNLSLGGSFDPSVYGCGHSPLCRELRRLHQQGMVVCLAAGNEGLLTVRASTGPTKLNRDLSIADPANLDVAIAVGSVNKDNPHSYGISFFSSRGPTADGRQKPDLVAPGERILSARAGMRVGDASRLYVEMSGTSMAAPHVSGLLAAFLSERREFIGNPDRTKEILLEACTDLRRDPYFQGRGMPNLVQMLLST